MNEINTTTQKNYNSFFAISWHLQSALLFRQQLRQMLHESLLNYKLYHGPEDLKAIQKYKHWLSLNFKNISKLKN